MTQDIFASSPDIDLRKRWALMQLHGASDSSPVLHPLQAAARAMQGAMGGYLAHQSQEEDRAAREGFANSLPGLGGPPPSAPQPMPQASPTAGPMAATPAPVRMASLGTNDAPLPLNTRAPVAPSAKVWGDQEAVDAGLYEPQKGRPQQIAQALQPPAQPSPQMPPAGPQMAQAGGIPPQGYNAPVPNRSSVQIPPDVAATVKKLVSDPRTAPQGMQLYMQYAKPVESIQPMSPEQRKQWNVPEGVSAGVDSVTGKPVFSQPANSVNVNTAANPILEGVGKQIVSRRQGAQTAAEQTIPAIHEARKSLDAGTITGAFAEGRLGWSKVGALFGITDPSQIANTEVLSSSIGSGVLAHIKELGANPSNADRDYIEKVQGGKIALDEQSIRRILDIQEKYARNAVRNFNSDAKKLMAAQGGDQAYKSIAPLMSFEEPPEYKAAAKPAQQPAATEGATATNPKTGERVMFKGGQWVPAK